MMRPVLTTSSPSAMSVYGPRMTAPTVSSSRFSARPRTLDLGNSSSSLAMALERPQIRAMPSPTSMTVPDVLRGNRLVESLYLLLEDAADLFPAYGHSVVSSMDDPLVCGRAPRGAYYTVSPVIP